MIHVDDVLWHGENGGTTWETSHQCYIMRKVIHKEVGARRKVWPFLDSGLSCPASSQRPTMIGLEEKLFSTKVLIWLEIAFFEMAYRNNELFY